MVNALFTLVAVLAALLLTCHACLEEEARSLLLLKKMQKTNHFPTWKEGSDCCKNWERVGCNPLTHHVQSLDFHVDYYVNDYPQLVIKDCESLLPLSNLEGLTTLNMEFNPFNVSLVLACLGRFPSLSEINLANSQGGGSSISSAFQEWPSEALQRLTKLDLNWNLLSGSLPPQLQNMTSLAYLDLSGNNFTSNFHELCSLSNLRHLLLSDLNPDNVPWSAWNPDKVAWSAWNFSRLVELSLDDCSLQQHHIEQMKWLKLNKGPIPASIGGISALEQLDLSDNKLSGGIPTGFTRLDSMGFLNLSYNNLSGKIPRAGHMLTFDHQFFEGNPNLNDSLLLLDRKRHKQTQTEATSEEESGGHDQEFWWVISIGVSFGVGFATFVSAWVLASRFRKYVNSSMDRIILWLFRYRY